MSDSRPVIGVTCYVEDVDRHPWTAQRSVVLPHRYVDQLERAGALAVVLPPRPDADDDLALTVLERLDGLVIAGGADVEAARYGAAPHPTSQKPRPDRDAWELALARVSAALDLPVLGVCRGMQVMAVGAGGALEQHLPDLVGHDHHSPGADAFGDVAVRVAEESLLRDLVRADELGVHCHHHQSVRKHPGYTAVAWADDGTVEAMERPGERFCLGVQWHPEVAADAGLFQALVGASRRPRG